MSEIDTSINFLNNQANLMLNYEEFILKLMELIMRSNQYGDPVREAWSDAIKNNQASMVFVNDRDQMDELQGKLEEGHIPFMKKGDYLFILNSDKESVQGILDGMNGLENPLRFDPSPAKTMIDNVIRDGCINALVVSDPSKIESIQQKLEENNIPFIKQGNTLYTMECDKVEIIMKGLVARNEFSKLDADILEAWNDAIEKGDIKSVTAEDLDRLEKLEKKIERLRGAVCQGWELRVGDGI